MAMISTTAVNRGGRVPDAPVIPDATLPEFVLGQAGKRGSKRALVEAGTGRELSYAQLAATVRGTGGWLATRGVRPGDVLALCAPNSIEFAVTAYAALSAGAILTTVNPVASEQEIVHQLRQTGARWLVTTTDLFVPKLEQAAHASGIARSPDELAETVTEIELAGGTAAAAIADVTDNAATAAAVAELRERLGPIDVLINNAGVSGPVGPMWDADPADWWRTVQINLGGAYALTRIVLPQMIAAGRGRILNITSNAGVYRWPLVSAYATSKAALVKLTENLAPETRRHGVSVLSVDPGLLPIGVTEPVLNSTPDPDSAEARIAAWTRDRLAAGHGADPGRAAQLILQLARGRGDRLSGRHLTVADDLDTMLARIDQIQDQDLHTLRLRL